MGFGVKLQVWGEYACFTRPEMKAERVTYDIMTPSAARGILEAIYWKPAIRWIVDRIHVLNEIRFDNVRRNEVENKISARNVEQVIHGRDLNLHQIASEERQQRATLLLRDVNYIIEAHFALTGKAGSSETNEKHYNIALRRMREGQCFHRPYLGCREFPAHFRIIKDDDKPLTVHKGERDLGWMLWDMDFGNNMEPIFFRATLCNGVVQVPDLYPGGGHS